jgi:hypothetical protein
MRSGGSERWGVGGPSGVVDEWTGRGCFVHSGGREG